MPGPRILLYSSDSLRDLMSSLHTKLAWPRVLLWCFARQQLTSFYHEKKTRASTNCVSTNLPLVGGIDLSFVFCVCGVVLCSATGRRVPCFSCWWQRWLREGPNVLSLFLFGASQEEARCWDGGIWRPEECALSWSNFLLLLTPTIDHRRPIQGPKEIQQWHHTYSSTSLSATSTAPSPSTPLSASLATPSTPPPPPEPSSTPLTPQSSSCS